MFSQKKDLNHNIDSFQKRIGLLEGDIQSKNTELESIRKASNSKKSLFPESTYQKILSENNKVYFLSLFDKKYSSDTGYFNKTDLSDVDDLFQFDNYNVIIENIVHDTSVNKNKITLAMRAKQFNDNYKRLFFINKEYSEFTNSKYDSLKADSIKTKLKSLNLANQEKLNTRRENINKGIENYLRESCEVKSNLNRYKDKRDQGAIASNYQELKKKYKYPYLQKVITAMSKDVKSYSEDSLPNCINNN